ncbi:MAG: hypothetical protein QOG48_469 [Verrucomicrobiota bacterium]|jgi:hypothetical protein
MDDVDLRLKRLLRATSREDVDLAAEMPFAFDTRVVAIWRSTSLTNGNGLARLLRRVALGAVTIIVLSSAAVAREYVQARKIGEPMTNEYALADSAIEIEMSR